MSVPQTQEGQEFFARMAAEALAAMVEQTVSLGLANQVAIMVKVTPLSQGLEDVTEVSTPEGLAPEVVKTVTSLTDGSYWQSIPESLLKTEHHKILAHIPLPTGFAHAGWGSSVLFGGFAGIWSVGSPVATQDQLLQIGRVGQAHFQIDG